MLNCLRNIMFNMKIWSSNIVSRKEIVKWGEWSEINWNSIKFKFAFQSIPFQYYWSFYFTLCWHNAKMCSVGQKVGAPLLRTVTSVTYCETCVKWTPHKADTLYFKWTPAGVPKLSFHIIYCKINLHSVDASVKQTQTCNKQTLQGLFNF